jgi:hypothetical protein
LTNHAAEFTDGWCCQGIVSRDCRGLQRVFLYRYEV